MSPRPFLRLSSSSLSIEQGCYRRTWEAVFQRLCLAFLGLALVYLPFCRDSREKVAKMKLIDSQRFLLTIQLGFSGMIYERAFTAEVVDLFLEIISRH